MESWWRFPVGMVLVMGALLVTVACDGMRIAAAGNGGSYEGKERKHEKR